MVWRRLQGGENFSPIYCRHASESSVLKGGTYSRPSYARAVVPEVRVRVRVAKDHENGQFSEFLWSFGTVIGHFRGHFINDL